MEVTVKRKVILWSLWLLIVPPGLLLIYRYFPPSGPFGTELIAFSVLAVLTAFMPLTINGTPLYLVQWVTIAVFLKYGIFVEILLSQLTMIVLLFRSRSNDPRSIRFPFNSFMFFILSAVAGFTYLLAGGNIGSFDLLHVIYFSLIYQLVYIVANHIFLYVYSMLIGEYKRFLSIDTIWDFVITFLVFPYAITLYITNAFIGLPALLLLGIPFLMMTALLRMYNNSERINNDLKKTGAIGHQLAARLSVDEVLDQFVLKVAHMFRAEFAYILDYRNGKLQMLRMFENGEFQSFKVPPVRYNKGIAGLVLVTDTPVIYHKKKQWNHIIADYVPEGAESLMATLISRNNYTEGVLVLASKKKHAFVSHQLKILDILSTHLAVAHEKAEYVETAIAKSERCGLTKLYNYRYLEEKLTDCMQQVNAGELEHLSLVMMDIDHFKAINDEYGHQSGNDILVQLAGIIKEEVGSEGTVARYGGEEFVVLFTDYGKDLTLLFAEKLRQRIEDTEFEIQSDLGEERETLKVKITLSIGVSTAPEDSDEAMSLIRNADRALYIGAKQAGRNKVAAYAK
ncbi:sensor domain-containing diguanylate cyclase [Planococcus salinus]|uniref:GGDEF domain-containing protein n=1 Tax=Planococcus salinus TaxID=1848460 RepID=A0A3M8PB59_9BACL|nr:sensor domain-containing diguanylate cyclase [Planococcus salinus]RNF40925.1 GGDEF domain-containing protein [Planococcus salinus]